MTLPDFDRLKESIEATAQAASYVGKAVVACAQGLVPVAKKGAAALPRQALALASGERGLDASASKKGKTALVCAGAACGAVLLAASVAHVVHGRRVSKAYKAEKRRKAFLRDKKRVLSEAVYLCPAESFEEVYAAKDENLEAEATLSLQAGGPGCFAVLAYADGATEGALEEYEGVFVGAAKDMAEGVHEQLSGKGNLYVRADVVYGRVLYVAFFPCEAYQLYAYRERLIGELRAESSYNRIDDVLEID